MILKKCTVEYDMGGHIVLVQLRLLEFASVKCSPFGVAIP